MQTTLADFSDFSYAQPRLTDRIQAMTRDRSITDLLHAYGLVIQTVSWEDTARYKGSCVGPNISDMTLNVNGQNMPVIRRPNFSDVTCDRNINDFHVTVGNELDTSTTRIQLSDYLNNLSKYTNIDKLYSGDDLCKSDETILISSQLCL